MPFVGRGWHACTTLPDPKDRDTTKLNLINDAKGKKSASKIYLSGGEYMGIKGNENVRNMVESRRIKVDASESRRRVQRFSLFHK